MFHNDFPNYELRFPTYLFLLQILYNLFLVLSHIKPYNSKEESVRFL